MSTDTMELPAVETLEIRRSIDIAAPIEIAFEAVLEELGPGSTMHDGTPYPLKLEPWPGGRWYRDLGESGGHKYGHFWAHVQVIKTPTLLEICGPMMMSYPAINHLQYRLTAQGGGTRVTLLHRAMGPIAPEHREGMPKGWEHKLNRARELAERTKGAAGKNTKEANR